MIWIIGLIVLGWATVSDAATYYVSPNGNNLNSCAAAQDAASPRKNITNAALCVVAGDTLVAIAGTYNEPCNTGANPDRAILTAASGTSSARIRYVSETRWGALIRSACQAIWRNTGSYVDIEGFDIADSRTVLGQTGGLSDVGIVNVGSYVRFLYNHVHHIPVTAAAMAAGNGGTGLVHGEYTSVNNDTIGNWVHHIGNPPDNPSRNTQMVHGIYNSTVGGKIQNNVVYLNEAYGIHLYHFASNQTVTNNLAFNNFWGGILVGNNEGTMDQMEVNNNITVNSRNRGIWCGGLCLFSNSFYRNNISYGNLTSNMMGAVSGLTISGTITATTNAAVFVNYQANGSGDYHHATGSPAIDGGVSNGAPAIDLDGQARPINTLYDIGPYEKTAAVVTYTLTINVTGTGSVSSSPSGITCPTDCTEVYNTGTSVALTAVAGGGYVFTGWSGSGCSGILDCTVVMNADRLVSAVFVILPPAAPTNLQVGP